MSVPTPTSQFFPTLQRSANSLFTPVQRELDRIFDQLGSSWSNLAEVGLVPRMDLVETKEALELTFELPGLKEGDVKIAVEDGLLTVSGEKKAETKTEDRNQRVVERSYGAFERVVSLPRNVDAGAIKATLADGVLKVVAPKVVGAEARTIEVKPGK
jgi:HSP20 family protein